MRLLSSLVLVGTLALARAAPKGWTSADDEKLKKLGEAQTELLDAFFSADENKSLYASSDGSRAAPLRNENSQSIQWHYRDCVPASSGLVFDTESCGVNPFRAYIVKPSERSPFADFMNSLTRYSKLAYMLGVSGNSLDMCSDLDARDCTLETTEGLCYMVDDKCTMTAFSGPITPIVPKYACASSLLEKTYRCWRWAAVNGYCPDACREISDDDIGGSWTFMITTYVFSLFSSTRLNDPAMRCVPKELSGKRLDEINEAFINWWYDFEVDEEGRFYFGQSKLRSFTGTCPTNDLSAALFSGDLRSVMRADKTVMGTMNRACRRAASGLEFQKLTPQDCNRGKKKGPRSGFWGPRPGDLATDFPAPYDVLEGAELPPQDRK